MSRKGDCWDHAVAESFFATLKREVEEIDHLESHAQANAVLSDYIDRFYNFSDGTRRSATEAP
jgi:transposase InsO family protein